MRRPGATRLARLQVAHIRPATLRGLRFHRIRFAGVDPLLEKAPEGLPAQPDHRLPQPWFGVNERDGRL